MPRCETELRAPGDSNSELPASADTALPVRLWKVVNCTYVLHLCPDWCSAYATCNKREEF